MFLMLILKFSSYIQISDSQPISGVNTIYKIITKLLELLLLNESTFTNGQLISNNVLLIEEHLRGF